MTTRSHYFRSNFREGFVFGNLQLETYQLYFSLMQASALKGGSFCGEPAVKLNHWPADRIAARNIIRRDNPADCLRPILVSGTNNVTYAL